MTAMDNIILSTKKILQRMMPRNQQYLKNMQIMANRAEHNHKEIGGSTSEKSSPDSFIHLNYQETHHVSSSSHFAKSSVETNSNTTRSENSDLADNEATLLSRNKRYSNRNISKPNSDDRSRSARQHLLDSRINVRKVQIQNSP